MLGHLQFALVAFLMLSATSAAMIDSRIQPITSTETKMNQQLRLEAKMKALASLREVERAIASEMKQHFVSDDECFAKGVPCPVNAPEFCCSGKCVPHPRLRIFVCE